MTYDEVIAKLSDDEKQIVSSHIYEVQNVERQKGIDGTKKAREEVNRLLARYKPLEQQLVEAGIDTDQPIADQIKKVVGDKSSSQGDEFTKKLAALERKIAEKDKREQELTQQNAEKDRRISNAKLTDALSKAFGGKIRAQEYVIRDMINGNKVKISDDGETVVFVDGDAEVDFAAGVDRFKASNPDLIINQPNPGSGNPKPSQGGGDQKQTMTPLQMLRLER